MSVIIPTEEPTQLVAGDTAQWTRQFDSFPVADGWTLAYRLIGPSVPTGAIAVVATNNVFNVTIAPAVTAALAILGPYLLVGYVTSADLTQRYTVIETTIELLPNPATATFIQTQTHTQRMIAACEAALEGRLASDVASYGREGTMVVKLDIAEVRKTRGIYEAILWREQNEGKLLPISVVRFGQAAEGSQAERIAWNGLNQ